jgi:hypothetical protein
MLLMCRPESPPVAHPGRARLSSCQNEFACAVIGVEPGKGPVRGCRVNLWVGASGGAALGHCKRIGGLAVTCAAPAGRSRAGTCTGKIDQLTARVAGHGGATGRDQHARSRPAR